MILVMRAEHAAVVAGPVLELAGQEEATAYPTPSLFACETHCNSSLGAVPHHTRQAPPVQAHQAYINSLPPMTPLSPPPLSPPPLQPP